MSKPYTLEDWRLIAQGDWQITEDVEEHASSWFT